MALANYTDLTAQVASWIHRANLTTQIPDFVALAESEINTEMRLRLMQVDVTLTLAAGARTVALPARYLEPIKLDLVIAGRDDTELTYVSPKQLEVNAAAGVAGEPQWWTIKGDNIEFPYPADIAYTLNFRLLQGFDLASTTTNALMTKYPGIYLYGTLKQAALYIVDDPRAATWEAAYAKLKSKVNKQEGRDKALTTMRSEHPSVHTHVTNIFRG